jgi:adenosylmethionine-8-amino-7-oxononanoate aminotransferase
MAGIELVRDRPTKAQYDWSQRRGQQACQEALRHGVWLRPLGNVIVITPPLCVTLEQLDQICNAADAGVVASTHGPAGPLAPLAADH